MRRQTAAHAGDREVQVLDYQNTAADLLPLLAQAYALLFMVSWILPFYCLCATSWEALPADNQPFLVDIAKGSV